jgi:hypothetical protein
MMTGLETRTRQEQEQEEQQEQQEHHPKLAFASEFGVSMFLLLFMKRAQTMRKHVVGALGACFFSCFFKYY